MHCMTAYAVTMNLLNGYKFYTHEMPAWLPVGLAHWYARQIDERRNYFTEDKVFSETDVVTGGGDLLMRKSPITRSSSPEV